LPPLLEGVAETVALAPVLAFSRIWSVPVPPNVRPQAHGRGRLDILSREDKATAMRLLSLSGKPSAARPGPAVSTLIRKVSGSRRYRRGRFVGEAAMTNAEPLAGTWRCISPHVFAVVMARSGRLLSALRPMAPAMPTHKDHEKDVRAEACPRSWVEEKADAATGAYSSADAPKGRGSETPPPRPRTSRATLILRPRVIIRRGHTPRASCGLRVPLLVRLRLDLDGNGAPERVELSRAGAPGASQFGFQALDRILRPEPRDEFLDAAPKGAHEGALFLWRGGEVAVAIDLGHRWRVRLEGLRS